MTSKAALENIRELLQDYRKITFIEHANSLRVLEELVDKDIPKAIVKVPDEVNTLMVDYSCPRCNSNHNNYVMKLNPICLKCGQRLIW